ncbi:MAG: FAD-dependent oxidoreductase [Acidobacteria bacterium]|nr:FAD-dependent oxidoreductase [Acidobacteriota bacterium]MCG3193571.1 Glutamate synthase [NADPH] small chain [Thermoanaerobaculia bacterium]
MDAKRPLANEKELQDQIERRRSLTPRQRGQLPAVFWVERDARQRLLDRGEVVAPASSLQARAEAVRCLECVTSPCRSACPLGVDVPRFLLLAAEGEFGEAVKVIRKTSLMPAIAARLCPLEKHCQKDCTVSQLHKDLGYAVSVGRVEAFLADWDRANGPGEIPNRLPSSGAQVAVVGAGPAGLSCAAELRRLGHDVTVFEARGEAGGFFVHGIPEFRLPRPVVRAEVEALSVAGVEFELDTVVGKTITVDDMLADGYDAVFLAAGGGPPRLAGIPGETLNGVHSALEYLMRVNSHSDTSSPEFLPVPRRARAAVIGQDETALDAARSAVRFGSREVFLLAPEPGAAIAASEDSIRQAREEGVAFRGEKPVEILGSADGWVRGVGLLGPVAGSRPGDVEELAVELVIESLGHRPNSLLVEATPGLSTGPDGRVSVNPATLMTSRRGVFAGGDLVREGVSVIDAMRQGREAALCIDSFLGTDN